MKSQERRCLQAAVFWCLVCCSVPRVSSLSVAMRLLAASWLPERSTFNLFTTRSSQRSLPLSGRQVAMTALSLHGCIKCAACDFLSLHTLSVLVASQSRPLIALRSSEAAAASSFPVWLPQL